MPFTMRGRLSYLLFAITVTGQLFVLHQVKLYSPRAISDTPDNVLFQSNEIVAKADSHSQSTNRMIFFCYCYPSLGPAPGGTLVPSFISALEKISEITPITSHTIKTHNKDGERGGGSCEDEVERLVAESERDSVAASGASSRSFIEVFYNHGFDVDCHKRRNVNITTKVLEPWMRGAHLVPFPQEVNTRSIYDWGEVFHKNTKVCNITDTKTLNTYRSKGGITQLHNETCHLLHVPTIIFWAHAIHRKRIKDLVTNETLKEMLTRRLTYEEAKQELKNKTRFCGLVTFTTWKRMYPADALVRHALCRLLTMQYKPCDNYAQWKGGLEGYPKTTPSDTYKAQKNHKFVIAMANEFLDGYLVEKMINPYVAKSIAISATPNLGGYINDKRPVVCSVPRSDLEYVNQWKADGGKAFMPFNTTPEQWESDKTIQPIPYVLKQDEPLLEFIADAWKVPLQPCIDEIIRLDKDDESYIAKLREPFVTNFEDSLFDGTYVALSLLTWLSHVNSPVTFGIENIIQELGMVS